MRTWQVLVLQTFRVWRLAQFRAMTMPQAPPRPSLAAPSTAGREASSPLTTSKALKEAIPPQPSPLRPAGRLEGFLMCADGPAGFSTAHSNQLFRSLRDVWRRLGLMFQAGLAWVPACLWSAGSSDSTASLGGRLAPDGS